MKSRMMLSRILFVLYLAALAFLLFATSDQLPTVKPTLLGFPTDKVAHFMMFTPFPILAFLSTNLVSKKWWHCVVTALVILFIGAVVAACTEYAQGLLPYREAELNDFKADTIGMALSSVIVFLVDLINLPKQKKSRK